MGLSHLIHGVAVTVNGIYRWIPCCPAGSRRRNGAYAGRAAEIFGFRAEEIVVPAINASRMGRFSPPGGGDNCLIACAPEARQSCQNQDGRIMDGRLSETAAVTTTDPVPELEHIGRVSIPNSPTAFGVGGERSKSVSPRVFIAGIQELIARALWALVMVSG